MLVLKMVVLELRRGDHEAVMEHSKVHTVQCSRVQCSAAECSPHSMVGFSFLPAAATANDKRNMDPPLYPPLSVRYLSKIFGKRQC